LVLGDFTSHLGWLYVELWELYNLSGDIHPIHLHLVNFAVLERRRIPNPDQPDLTDPSSWAQVNVDPNENSGWKDTVRVNPGEMLVMLVQFRGHGGSNYREANFVWHCHLLEHEDMGMMRPLNVYY
jgi:spore coat protein A